jgi:hypothetical protein
MLSAVNLRVAMLIVILLIALMLCVILLIVMMLRHNADCHYAEGRYTVALF